MISQVSDNKNIRNKTLENKRSLAATFIKKNSTHNFDTFYEISTINSQIKQRSESQDKNKTMYKTSTADSAKTPNLTSYGKLKMKGKVHIFNRTLEKNAWMKLKNY